jgi:hypothetical protein
MTTKTAAFEAGYLAAMEKVALSPETVGRALAKRSIQAGAGATKNYPLYVAARSRISRRLGETGRSRMDAATHKLLRSLE